MSLGFRYIEEGYGVSLGDLEYRHLVLDRYTRRRTKSFIHTKSLPFTARTFLVRCGDDIHRVLFNENGTLAFPDHPEEELADRVSAITGMMETRGISALELSAEIDQELNMGCPMFLIAWRESIHQRSSSYILRCADVRGAMSVDKALKECIARCEDKPFRMSDALMPFWKETRAGKIMMLNRMRRNAFRRLIRNTAREMGWRITVVDTHLLNDLRLPLYMNVIPNTPTHDKTRYSVDVRASMWAIYRRHRSIACILPDGRQAIAVGLPDLYLVEVFTEPDYTGENKMCERFQEKNLEFLNGYERR